MSSKIKKSKLQKTCNNCYSPQYLKFNFSYLDELDDINSEYKLQLLDRIVFLSSSNYINILQYDKKKGIEFEDIDKIQLRKQIPAKFKERFHMGKYNNKIAIVRLYPNNNPIMGRIIGVVINNIFYIMFVDINGKLYNH